MNRLSEKKEVENTTTNDQLKKRNVRLTFLLAIIFTCFLLIDFLYISLMYSIFDWIALLIFSLLFIFPGYISNAGMVIVGGGKPIDGGRMWRDGGRILGDHKTWNGLIKGPLYIGIPLSIVLFLIFRVLWAYIVQIPLKGIKSGVYLLYNNLYYYQYYFLGGSAGFIGLLLRVIFCSYGASIGDLVGSFLKRRFSIKSGDPFWVIDQLDFVVFSILFALIPNLFFPQPILLPDLNVILFLIILTPSVSIIANTIAYFLNLKDVPW